MKCLKCHETISKGEVFVSVTVCDFVTVFDTPARSMFDLCLPCAKRGIETLLPMEKDSR